MTLVQCTIFLVSFSCMCLIFRHHQPFTRAGAVLRLEVFDKDNTSADDRLGYVEVPIESLLGGRKEDHWLRLVLATQFRKHLRALKVSAVGLTHVHF